MTLLVIDVGTSGVRAGAVRPDGSLMAVHHRRVAPIIPLPGFVELDPMALAQTALEVAAATLADVGPVEAVGVTNQRATTIVWERSSGQPIGPGIGWQDIRTVGMCLDLARRGIHLAPNESATKLIALLELFDPKRSKDVCFGTVDTWIVWNLSRGELHVTDPSNAALTGMLCEDASGWSAPTIEALGIPERSLPELVDSSGIVGHASELAGSPPIAAMVGDQQASLVGQGCTLPGLAKATFGTGGIFDLCLGAERPGHSRRGPAGTYPVVAWKRDGRITWGAEAIMLSAGSTVDYVCEELELADSPASTDAIAAQAGDPVDVWFVPALAGLGTPVWDFGARGLLLGLTRDTTSPQIVRAMLEGIAHRGADLLDAAETDGDCHIDSLRVDGGMSANQSFLQYLADALWRPVEVSPVLEATTLGAAYLAGLAVGTWADESELASLWQPRQVVEPRHRPDRERWLAARERARSVIPELSALQF